MKFKFQILFLVLIVFLSLSCVSADEDVGVGDSNDIPAPTYYNVTEESYSSYFDDNGTFTVSPSEGELSVVRIGSLTGKNLIFNQPNLVITSLDESSIINGGVLVLNPGATGSYVSGLHISTGTMGVAGILNYANNVYIAGNDIGVFGGSLYGIYSMLASNVVISRNSIFMNVSSNYTYAIAVSPNPEGDAVISNYNISDNYIFGLNYIGYLGAILDTGGLTDSIITNNNITLISNVAYGITTNTKSGMENATGNILISNNTILINSDLGFAIQNLRNRGLYILNNHIQVVSNGAIGIASAHLEGSTIYGNELSVTSGRLLNEYQLSIGSSNVGIYVAGVSNIIDNNQILGVNIDGIILEGSTNIVSFNTLQLQNNENVIVDSNGLSRLTGITATYSINNIIGNRILINANTTYGYGIALYNPQYNVSNFLVENNTVLVYLNNIYGDGLYTRGLSASIINHNSFIVETRGYSYGILSDALTGDITGTLIITNNSILTTGGDVRGIEVTNSYGDTIVNNNITSSGDAVYGIATGNVIYSQITDNSIVTQAGNLANVQTYEAIPAGQAAIRLYASAMNTTVANNKFEGLTNINTTNATGEYIIENNSNALSVFIFANETIINVETGGNFTGIIFDVFTRPVVGHHIYINLSRVSNGQSKIYEVISDFNGEFKLPINLGKGEYTAEIHYPGAEIGSLKYLPTDTDKISIKVTDIDDNRTETVITASGFSKKTTESKNFTGTLKDINGNILAGHHVQITLTRISSGASKTYDSVADFTGEFVLQINLAKGEYTVQVTYTGTNIYKPSSTSELTISITD